MPKISIIEMAPAIFILLFLVFAMNYQLKKKNAKTIDELKEENPEKWRTVVRRSAILKFLVFCVSGLIWLGIIALNLANMPAGNMPNVVFMSLLGFFFIAMGIWSYFLEMKKLRN